jgi:hypothetical protein
MTQNVDSINSAKFMHPILYSMFLSWKELVLSAVEFDAHYNAVEKSSTSITVSVN